MFVVDTIILVVSTLLLFGVASSKLSNRLGVPVLVLFMGLGMLAGSEGIGRIEFDNYKLAHGISTVALAIILFDGGLNTTLGAIRTVWKPSFVLATFGVLVTSVVTGYAAHLILDLSLMEGMLIGSIVGSTDAAAVFAVLRSGGVALSKKMAALLEVESGSNDPMAIFLTIGCIEIISGKMELGPEIVGLFITQMVVGAIFGVILGYAALWLINRVELSTSGLYPVLAMALCLSIFGITAWANGSGFLAVYIAGIVMGNQRMVFQNGVRLYMHGLGWLSQIVLFVVLGLLCNPSELLKVSVNGLLISLVLILVARPVAVLLSMLPFDFNWREIGFASTVGLKGAVPIVLATFPALFEMPNASLYFNIVFFIVVVSATIQGGALSFLARAFGLQETPEPEAPMRLELHSLRHIEGDVVDFHVREESKVSRRQIKDLGLPPGAVIAIVARGDQMISPNGKTELAAGDHAILILEPGTLEVVQEIFAESPPEEIEDGETLVTGSV